jgi:UDP-N-acetylglucosamine--N-acetylmuramyl-(pentapeptide) pyrophosphoryl-undecaprenol N-acetylglucosamine transferase
MTPRIAFLVTHLMGSGHFVRTLAIAHAVHAAGGRALVISGGRPLPHIDDAGIDVVQLAPLSIRHLDYKTLRGPDGTPAEAAYMAARSAAIAAALTRFAPDVLVTELFPFGRRALAPEFGAAIAARPARCRLAVSIRDVLETPSKPKRAEETRARLAPFDLILIHGEAAVAPLALSWPGHGLPPAPDIVARIAYTGYVLAPAPAAAAAADGPGAGEILVSVGGGAVGRGLLDVAAQAATLSARPWRLLVGDPGDRARLCAIGPAVVEPLRKDYRAMLRRAALSVSLAGYNTAVDAAVRGGPSILIAMEEGGEVEQVIRADAFAALPGVTCLRIAGLTPDALHRAAEAAIAAWRPHPAPLRTDGAADSARRLVALAGA